MNVIPAARSGKVKGGTPVTIVRYELHCMCTEAPSGTVISGGLGWELHEMIEPEVVRHNRSTYSQALDPSIFLTSSCC